MVPKVPGFFGVMSLSHHNPKTSTIRYHDVHVYYTLLSILSLPLCLHSFDRTKGSLCSIEFEIYQLSMKCVVKKFKCSSGEVWNELDVMINLG